MKDNFDLKKFLKENNSLENLNPSLKNINEGEKKQLNENSSLRSKIREMVISELSEETLQEEDILEEDTLDEAKKDVITDSELDMVTNMLTKMHDKLDLENNIEKSDALFKHIEGFFENLDVVNEEEDTLEEAKEDEEEEITDETDEIETEEETEEVDVESGGGLEDISADMEGTEGELMDHLMSAFKMSKGMDNEKLETQIGNTLKFFVSEFISSEEN
jgi:hypothetical protein